MVVAGSVTLSTSKNRGYLFSYPTEIVIDVSKGLFSPCQYFKIPVLCLILYLMH